MNPPPALLEVPMWIVQLLDIVMVVVFSASPRSGSASQCLAFHH